MSRLLYRIARIVLKHYADRIYIEQAVFEHEQRMKDFLKDQFAHRPTISIVNHYLIQYALPGSERKLWALLIKMEKYRLRDSFEDMSHYTFDFDSYYKTDVYALWGEILLCLQMKKTGLAKYLKEFTNLADEDSIRTICNSL